MDVRTQALRHLATPQADTAFGRSAMAREIAAATGCRVHEVNEALWGLVGEGLVYLDPATQPSPDNWHWKLSAVGVQAVNGGSWEPRDPEAYLARLRRHSPEVDPAAVRYVTEALSAFNARCFLASAVMLGVASERIVEGLARSVADYRGESAKRLRAALEDPRTSQFSRFTEMRKQIEPIRPELPDGTADTLTLDAVADLLRVTRNEAGHPTGGEIDEDTAYTHLQMAARYILKMTDLKAFLEAAGGK